MLGVNLHQHCLQVKTNLLQSSCEWETIGLTWARILYATDSLALLTKENHCSFRAIHLCQEHSLVSTWKPLVDPLSYQYVKLLSILIK